MNKRIRQYIGLLSAVLMYYIIHEGAHLLYALSTGVFRQINFMGIGMQIGIYEERMSETGLGIFCSVGVAATMMAEKDAEAPVPFTITAKGKDGTVLATRELHFDADKEKMYLTVTADGQIVEDEAII